MSEDMLPSEVASDRIAESAPVWSEKVWGECLHVFASQEAAVSILRVKKGFRCSRHLHTHRINKFLVLSGKIEVWEWASVNDVHAWPNDPVYRHLLIPMNFPQASVGVGRPHMFRVLESGIVVEVYRPDGGPVDIDDITRFDEGGPDER